MCVCVGRGGGVYIVEKLHRIHTKKDHSSQRTMKKSAGWVKSKFEQNVFQPLTSVQIKMGGHVCGSPFLLVKQNLINHFLGAVREREREKCRGEIVHCM